MIHILRPYLRNFSTHVRTVRNASYATASDSLVCHLIGQLQEFLVLMELNFP